MIEMIRKMMLASLGAAAVTKEKMEETIRRLVDEGKISLEEAKKIEREVVESGERQWQEMHDSI